MADLLAMSSGIIDGTTSADNVGPINRINHELSVIADGVAMVEAFSHCILFETDDWSARLRHLQSRRRSPGGERNPPLAG
ncbi:MAG: hypothetical protein U5Q16_10080 [Gammaproteobacteria bacterium]|nr:hypothetical protein [Gammaproteobacteria bacterium]